MVLIIVLSPKGQPTFVEDEGPIQVRQASPCGLRPVYLIYLFSQKFLSFLEQCLFIKSCIFSMKYYVFF
jgi:hypothetical protein